MASRAEITGRRGTDTTVTAKRSVKSVANNSIEVDPSVSDEIEPFAPVEGGGGFILAQPVARGPPKLVKLAFSIAEFCTAHGISEAFYFELQKTGKGPKVMRVGTRRLISIEAAARWREAMSDTAS